MSKNYIYLLSRVFQIRLYHSLKGGDLCEFIFVKMKEANNMGLNIRVATNGKSFEELNDDDIKKIQALQEAEYAKKKKDWDNAIYSNHFYTMEELAKNLSAAMNTDGEFKEVKIIDGYKIYIAES